MRAAPKEGWFEDPAGHHEFRWFSAGRPTELVRDGAVTGRDRISMSDPELFEPMSLADPPDVTPLSRSTNDDPLIWATRAGLAEQLLVVGCLIAAIVFLFGGGLVVIGVGLLALGLAIGTVGWIVRGRRLRRWRRAARGERV